MASLKNLKKDIDYLIEEVVSDCYVALYFNAKNQEGVVALIQEAISFRNELFLRINNPAEKNNSRLMKKHYSQIRQEMFAKVDDLFAKLSALNA